MVGTQGGGQATPGDKTRTSGYGEGRCSCRNCWGLDVDVDVDVDGCLVSLLWALQRAITASYA